MELVEILIQKGEYLMLQDFQMPTSAEIIGQEVCREYNEEGNDEQ